MLDINIKHTMRLLFTFSLLIHKNQGKNIDYLTIPKDFSIGTVISAYQVEGAWNVDGRSEGITDRLAHSNNLTNGDVSVDFYNRYKEDIKLLHELGVKHLKFSFSWSRLLPSGYVASANRKGIQFYHNVLNELEKYNITPIVSIYHFDHPQALIDIGGWMNERMAYVYADYAKFVFEEFGRRIKIFSTINEIYIACKYGYETQPFFPPGLNYTGIGYYVCATNMLKGHALAYHTYNKEYRHKYNGEIGIVETCSGFFNDGPNYYNEATDIAYAFDCGLTYHPIYSKKGNFPDIVIRNVEERSKLQGYKKSRLPKLSAYWINTIRGSADYLGLNYYSSLLVKKVPRSQMKNWEDDSGTKQRVDLNWPKTEFPFFYVYPPGLGYVIKKVKKEYNNPKIYILENGVAVKESEEKRREEYYYDHLKEVLTAVKRDKCNVKMYTVWSFLDDFENVFGYNPRFGLVSVDVVNDKNLTRKVRKSSLYLKSIIQTGKLFPPQSRIQYNYNINNQYN